MQSAAPSRRRREKPCSESVTAAEPKAKRGRNAHIEGQEGWTNLASGGATWRHEGFVGEGAWVGYWKRVVDAEQGRQAMQQLVAEAGLEQREIFIMGRRTMQPRKVSYMADDASLQYTYSRTTMEPLPWHPAAMQLKQRVEDWLVSEAKRNQLPSAATPPQPPAAGYNCVLINLYRDGQDCMGWHSDNEPLYGANPHIGSLSLGAARDFLLRHRQLRHRRYRFQLQHGDLLVMAGTTQDLWQHAVPRRARVEGARLNLTLRAVLHPEKPRPSQK